MKKKYTLKQLFEMRSCAGWAWECKGKRHYYCWQNDNDLGLLCDIKECIYPETVVKRVKVIKGKYIYILRNNWGIDAECGGDPVTMPQLKAAIKECHKGSWDKEYQMTKHDKMLAGRVWGYTIE